MALSIKSDKADRLARELAARFGSSLTKVVEESLEASLARSTQPTEDESGRVLRALHRLQDEVAGYRVTDPRSPDEIVGYDGFGAPR